MAANILNLGCNILDFRMLASRRQPGPAPSRPGRTRARGSGPGRAAAAWPPPGILYISCIYLYIFGYILVHFLVEKQRLRHQKKNLNIAKYMQIYTKIYKIFGYILVYIFVYIFGIFSAWLRHRVLYGPRPDRSPARTSGD